MSVNSWVETTEGWGEIVESSQSRFGSTNYRVIGSFGEGWFSSREILSEDFTTDLNFEHEDGGGKHNTTQVPEENHWLDEGTKLPWNPKPTAEWDGELNQEFEDHDISLSDTNSLKGHDVHPDPDDHNSIYEHSRSASFLDRTAFDSEDSDWAEEADLKDLEEGKGKHDKTARGFADEEPEVWDNDQWNPDDIHSVDPTHGYGHNPRNQQQSDTVGHLWKFDNDPDQRVTKDPRHANVGPRTAFVDYVNLIENNTLIREAAWKDVRTKANRLWSTGKVYVQSNDGREILAQVDGDHDRYDVQVHRKNAFGKGITWYDCNCEWGKWAYKRERSFIGRLCSHGLATYYAMQANVQPTKRVKKIDNKTERHSLAAVDYTHGEAKPSQSDLAYEPNIEDPQTDVVGQLQDAVKNKYVRKAPVVSSIPVERESLASQQGGISRRNAGLMVWDDNLPKVMKEFFNKEIPQNMGGDTAPADPSAALGGDPAAAAPAGDPVADLSSQLSADPSVDPAAAGPTTPDQYVRTAGGAPQQEFNPGPVWNLQHETENTQRKQKDIVPDHAMFGEGIHYKSFEPNSEEEQKNVKDNGPWHSYSSVTAEFSKDPSTDALFEEQGDDKDDTQFNDTGKRYKEKDNDPEYAFYDEFWGRSSAVGEVTPDAAPLPEPGRKLPHFIRQRAQQAPAKPVFASAEDAVDIEKVDEHNIDDAIKTYKLNGDAEAAHKMVQQRYKKKHHGAHTDGDEDYEANTEKDHETSWQAHPDENMDGGDGKDHQEQYQSEHWLDEDEAEWNEHDPSEHGDDDDEEDHQTKSARYQNALEADEFNNGADDIVREFQRSAAGMAIFSHSSTEETGGAFLTAVDAGEMTLSRTAGRHFTFAEQQELIDEPGTARHLADLNLKGTFYEDQR